MHLISSFNSLTTFNYSPHSIITTNRHTWGTFEYILSDTWKPILSECKLHAVQLQSVAAGCGHYRHAIVAKWNIYLKKSRHYGVRQMKALGILYIIPRNFSLASCTSEGRKSLMFQSYMKQQYIQLKYCDYNQMDSQRVQMLSM